jgi:uncharacterized protein YndB with AHSA1/START domain
MTKNKITIQAIVSANKQKTWNYYTQPEHIVHWNFATDDWQCPRASNDLSVGGKYIARMEAKDGSVGFDFEATYTEIIEGEKFTYTMPDSRVVHVRFNGAGDKTEVVITFDAETENSLELQRSGWQAILNNFKEYTESH